MRFCTSIDINTKYRSQLRCTLTHGANAKKGSNVNSFCECTIRVYVFNVCFVLFTLIFQALCALHFRIFIYMYISEWHASRLHVRAKLKWKLKGKMLPSCFSFSLRLSISLASGFLFSKLPQCVYVCASQHKILLNVACRTLKWTISTFFPYNFLFFIIFLMHFALASDKFCFFFFVSVISFCDFDLWTCVKLHGKHLCENDKIQTKKQKARIHVHMKLIYI